jgi:hypothetical protein
MLKFFFYMTNVDEGSGPHIFARGTHRGRLLKHQLSLTVGRPLDEIAEVYGADRILHVTGPAGTGFAEDPFGYHAGSLSKTTPRLLLEIGFGINMANRRRFYGERVLSPSPRRRRAVFASRRRARA